MRNFVQNIFRQVVQKSATKNFASPSHPLIARSQSTFIPPLEQTEYSQKFITWLERNNCSLEELKTFIPGLELRRVPLALKVWNTKNNYSFKELTDLLTVVPFEYRLAAFLEWNKDNDCSLDEFKLFLLKIPPEDRISALRSQNNNLTFNEFQEILPILAIDNKTEAFSLYIRRNNCSFDEFKLFLLRIPPEDRISAFRSWNVKNKYNLEETKEITESLPKVHKLTVFEEWSKKNIHSLKELKEIAPEIPDDYRTPIIHKCIEEKINEIEFKEFATTIDLFYDEDKRLKLVAKWLKGKGNKLENQDRLEAISYVNNILRAKSCDLIETNLPAKELIEFLNEFHFSKKIIDPIPQLYRTMGIEIEFCSRDLPKYPTGWNLVNDSSIRSHDSTKSYYLELVSPVFNSKKSLSEVANLGESISLFPCNAETNDSCGFHVHVGVVSPNSSNPEILTDENMSFIKQILINYAMLEELGLGFPERKFKMTKLKLSTKSDTLQQMESIIKTPYIEDVMKIIRSARNTDPVNLHAIFKHKTVEFRAHSGTVDAMNMISWMKFVNELVGLSEDMVKKNGKACVTDEMREFLKGEKDIHKNDPGSEELKRMHIMLSELRANNSCVNNEQSRPSTIVNASEYRLPLSPDGVLIDI